MPACTTGSNKLYWPLVIFEESGFQPIKIESRCAFCASTPGWFSSPIRWEEAVVKPVFVYRW
jgi:hypothetical protein